jgi:hypothetical protein
MISKRKTRFAENPPTATYLCFLPPAWTIAAVSLLAALPALSQDIEPRRWSHLPIGANFIGGAYAYSEGTITFNPVLRIEDGKFDLNSVAAEYIYSFELLGKSARFDLLQTYQSGTWSGLLNGEPASVDRDGWADTALRFAVNLYGAPPLKEQENSSTTGKPRIARPSSARDWWCSCPRASISTTGLSISGSSAESVGELWFG